MPANFVMALAQLSDLYNVFSRPLANKDWHWGGLKLVFEIEKAPGKRVAELIKQDLADLLKANGMQSAWRRRLIQTGVERTRLKPLCN